MRTLKVTPILILLLFVPSLLITMMVSGQTQTLYVIDNFSVTQDALNIFPQTSVPPAINIFSSVKSPSGNNSNILGDERDLNLIASQCPPNHIITAGVLDSELAIEVAPNSKGSVVLQYDGVDNSIDINVGGFNSIQVGGLDFSNATAMLVVYSADSTSSLTFNVFDVFGQICQITAELTPSTGNNQQLVLPVVDFSDSCIWSNIGAVEVVISVPANSEVVISNISVINII